MKFKSQNLDEAIKRNEVNEQCIQSHLNSYIITKNENQSNKHMKKKLSLEKKYTR